MSVNTLNTLGVFDYAKEHGFSEPQARALVTLIDNTESKTKDLSDRVIKIQSDIAEIKVELRCGIESVNRGFKHIDTMIYGLGAWMLAGFSLIVYFVKG